MAASPETRPNLDWAELRRRLEGALGRICPHWLAERREDLVQAALVKMMEIEKRREGETEWTSFYLSRVAHSALVDEIRRRRRRPEDPLDQEAETVVETAAADPERGAFGRELGRGLRACLAGLVEARRRASTLHLLGHGTLEVARLLGWEAKKAENAIYRGLADLRLCLEKKGFAP